MMSSFLHVCFAGQVQVIIRTRFFANKWVYALMGIFYVQRVSASRACLGFTHTDRALKMQCRMWFVYLYHKNGCVRLAGVKVQSETHALWLIQGHQTQVPIAHNHIVAIGEWDKIDCSRYTVWDSRVPKSKTLFQTPIPTAWQCGMGYHTIQKQLHTHNKQQPLARGRNLLSCQTHIAQPH